MKDTKQNATAKPGAVGQKALLRQALLAKRAATPAAVRQANDRAICKQISELPAFQCASLLLLYAPIGEEINLFSLIGEAAKRTIPVALPCTNKQTRELTFRFYSPGTPLVTGVYGISEPPAENPVALPDQDALCLLPALGYDNSFFRIGYGGGYYDRFLQTFPGKKIGVCYEQALSESVFPEPHDQPVDFLVTESRVLKKKG